MEISGNAQHLHHREAGMVTCEIQAGKEEAVPVEVLDMTVPPLVLLVLFMQSCCSLSSRTLGHIVLGIALRVFGQVGA